MVKSDHKRLATVAEFYKDAGGKLTLYSLTSIGRGVDPNGREYTFRDYYDVEYSRRYGYLFHQSGAGGDGLVVVSGIYFASGKAAIKETPCKVVDSRDKPPWRGKKTRAIRALNRTRRLRKLPKSFTADTPLSRGIKPGEDLLDWLEANAIQQDAVYCSGCRDFVPGNDLCQHCWWCDKTGRYSTPAERCKCANREECNG